MEEIPESSSDDRESERSIETINSAIQEYLQRRGFVKTLEAFQADLESLEKEKSSGGRPETASTYPALLNVAFRLHQILVGI